jgi:hypothetical protein
MTLGGAAKAGVRLIGHDQTEIDAMVELYPEALREAVFDAIRPFYDFGLNSRVLAAEIEWRKKAGKALQAHPKAVGQDVAPDDAA